MREEDASENSFYYVSDQDLRRYAELSCEERLSLVDELRLYILAADTPKKREQRKRMRPDDLIHSPCKFST